MLYRCILKTSRNPSVAKEKKAVVNNPTAIRKNLRYFINNDNDIRMSVNDQPRKVINQIYEFLSMALFTPSCTIYTKI